MIRTHKGSEVSADQITVVAEGRLGQQLGATVAYVLDLATALRGRSQEQRR